MTTDNFCFYLQNRLTQTSQTGGQWYINTSPFSIPWFQASSPGRWSAWRWVLRRWRRWRHWGWGSCHLLPSGWPWRKCLKTCVFSFVTDAAEKVGQGSAFVPGRPLQPIIMSASKARRLSYSVTPERCYARIGSGLPYWLEWPVRS